MTHQRARTDFSLAVEIVAIGIAFALLLIASKAFSQPADYIDPVPLPNCMLPDYHKHGSECSKPHPTSDNPSMTCWTDCARTYRHWRAAAQWMLHHWACDGSTFCYGDFSGTCFIDEDDLDQIEACFEDTCGPIPWGDVTGSGTVGTGDLIYMLDNWGLCSEPEWEVCYADITLNHSVGVADLVILLDNWSH